eukprot:scaffold18002_cov96-Isochrysis_galbana.AAC.2
MLRSTNVSCGGGGWESFIAGQSLYPRFYDNFFHGILFLEIVSVAAHLDAEASRNQPHHSRHRCYGPLRHRGVCDDAECRRATTSSRRHDERSAPHALVSTENEGCHGCVDTCSARQWAEPGAGPGHECLEPIGAVARRDRERRDGVVDGKAPVGVRVEHLGQQVGQGRVGRDQGEPEGRGACLDVVGLAARVAQPHHDLGGRGLPLEHVGQQGGRMNHVAQRHQVGMVVGLEQSEHVQ